jgi:hypothetical protein
VEVEQASSFGDELELTLIGSDLLCAVNLLEGVVLDELLLFEETLITLFLFLFEVGLLGNRMEYL